jgi:hypothetical protein
MEEGRIDELTSYMKQRLLDYNGEQISRRQARAQTKRHTRPDPITQEQKTAKQIITKASKNVMGKAIKTFAPSNTHLTDQQKKTTYRSSYQMEPLDGYQLLKEKSAWRQHNYPQDPP